MLEVNGLSNLTSMAGSIFSPDTELSLNKLVSQLVCDDHEHMESSKSFGFNVNATPFHMREPQPGMRAQDNFRNEANNYNFNEALDKLTAFALGPDTQKGNSYNGEVYETEQRRTMRFGSYSSDVSSASSISSDHSYNNCGSLDSCFQDAPPRKPYERDSFMVKGEQASCDQLPFGRNGNYSVNNALSAFLGSNVGPKEPIYQARKPNYQRQYQVRTEVIMPSSGRQIRGSSARSVPVAQTPTELVQYVEKANLHLRCLEKDRKKTETELSRMFPGKKFSGTNQIPGNRLRQNPSRLDRLLNDMAREQAKVVTLVTQMEHIGEIDLTKIHRELQSWVELVRILSSKRKDELLCPSTPVDDIMYEQKLSEEILLDVQKLCGLTRAARTTLWCAFTALIYDEKNEASPSAKAQTGILETRGEHLYPAPPATHHLLQELFKLYEKSGREHQNLLAKQRLSEEHSVPVELSAAGTPPGLVA